jgi:hypothetical protein
MGGLSAMQVAYSKYEYPKSFPQIKTGYAIFANLMIDFNFFIEFLIAENHYLGQA